MSHVFKETNLDTFVAALSDDERWQIILNYDELSRRSKIGDCVLRLQTEHFLKSQGLLDDSSYFVAHMIELGNACHKYRSIHQHKKEGEMLASIEDMRDLLEAVKDPQDDAIWRHIDEAIEVANNHLEANSNKEIADAQ